MDFLKKYDLRFFLIAALYFIVLNNLLLNGKILNYDDPIILEPLYKISSISDYIKAVAENKIWDIQPIRDLSYFIDFKLFSYFKNWSYHLSNYFFWTLIFVFFYKTSHKLLSQFYNNDSNLNSWVFFLAVLFYFHPVFQLEPFWISSRKHLLSTLFIFCSFYYFLKYDENENKSSRFIFHISFFYMLSVFSQPITIFYPFFLMVYHAVLNGLKWTSFRKHLLLYISVLFIFLLAFIANYVFYYIVYPKITQGQSVGFTAINMTQMRLLTIGRFFYQIFDITMASPVEHDRGSIRNIVGLLSFPLFIYLCYKLLDRKLLLILLAWFFFPLAIIIAGDVKLFALDTYLVTASLGILLLTLSLIIRFKFRTGYYVFLIPLIYLSYDYSKAFTSTFNLATYAQAKEITSFGQYMITNELVSKGQFNEAFEEAYAFSKIYPGSKELKFLLPIALMGSSKISPQKKKEIFSGWRKNSFLSEFYYSMFLNQNSREFREVQDKAIERIVESYYLNDLNLFSMHALSFYMYHCKKANLSYCDATFTRLKNLMPPGFWNENFYNNFYSAFSSDYGLQSLPKSFQNPNTEKSSLENILNSTK